MSTIFDEMTAADERDYRELLSIIQANRAAYQLVLKAVLEIRDRRLYRNSYASFTEFCEVELKMSRSNIDKLGRVKESLKRVKEVDPNLEVRIRSLDAALALGKCPDSHLEVVIKDADEGGRAGITAPQIEESIKRNVPPPPPPEVVQPIFPELEADVLDRQSIQKLRILDRVFKRIGSIDEQAQFVCRHFNELAIRISERISDN